MDQGIKPIIGMTVNVQIEENEPGNPFIVLAKNKTGYQQLLKLSTYLQTNHIDILTASQLSKYTEGVIGVLSGKHFLQGSNHSAEADTGLFFQELKKSRSILSTR